MNILKFCPNLNIINQSTCLTNYCNIWWDLDNIILSYINIIQGHYEINVFANLDYKINIIECFRYKIIIKKYKLEARCESERVVSTPFMSESWNSKKAVIQYN